MPIRTAFISFLECEIRGLWERKLGRPDFTSGDSWEQFSATLETDCEIWLVRPDGLRRAFRFKKNAVVAIGQMMVRFDQDDIAEELSVDENARKGKASPTVVGDE